MRLKYFVTSHNFKYINQYLRKYWSDFGFKNGPLYLSISAKCWNFNCVVRSQGNPSVPLLPGSTMRPVDRNMVQLQAVLAFRWILPMNLPATISAVHVPVLIFVLVILQVMVITGISIYWALWQKESTTLLQILALKQILNKPSNFQQLYNYPLDNLTNLDGYTIMFYMTYLFMRIEPNINYGI